MHVAINGLACIRGGTATELKNTLLGLSRIDNRNLYTTFYSDGSEPYVEEVRKLVPENFSFVKVAIPHGSVLRRMLWEQAVFPFILKRLGVDLLYSPTNLITWFAPCKKVVLVWDLNLHSGFRLEVYAGTKSALRFRLRRLFSRISCSRADKVVFASDHSKRLIAADFHIPAHKCVTIYRGISDVFFDEKDQNVNGNSIVQYCLSLKPYIFSCSVLYPHKNYTTLVEALAGFPNGFLSRYHLIVAGPVYDKEEHCKILTIAERCGIRDRIHFVGEVHQTLLPVIYRNAHVFVFPTLLESFGFPAVEAMASGVPVGVSDLPVMREICRDGAIYFDPRDWRAVAGVMEKILRDNDLRQSLRIAGQQRARDFSLRGSAEQLLQVLDDVVGGRSYQQRYAG